MEPRERPPAPPPNVRQACLITHLGSDPADQRLRHVSRLGSPIVMRPRFFVIAVRQQSRRRAPTPDGFALSPPRRFLGRQRWAVEQPVKPSSPFSHFSMAKRKKASKVQKRAKLRRGNSAKRGKTRRVTKAAKAKAKPKRATVKKVARKVKQPVAPVVETVAVETIEQSAPGVIAVTEVEEIRKAS